MFPAFRPNMISIVSLALAVRHGDEVYVQLASAREASVRTAFLSG